MDKLNMYQENLELLFKQRDIITKMPLDKQFKHLPKIDGWIEEIKYELNKEIRKTG